jgi:hypothetical protein
LYINYPSLKKEIHKSIMEGKLPMSQSGVEGVPWMKGLGAQLHEEWISSPSHPTLGPDDIVWEFGSLD